ncbi:polysaccharide lyase family 8 protein [Gymnopilus junonius]|uniref:Polysaccharide lyase family 8 protein n=1 Tax=Gymnopilus junonius TaxID=109634 RepID=A0A9P5P1R4_GYMJU|nr:polysaccharide lyase family 8 protein [Gymnopilus junonius]
MSASQNVTSSRTISSTSTTNQPTQSIDSSTLSDILSIQSRRLTSIIGATSSPKNIPAWLVTWLYDGKWPDSEVDYTTGCEARRANWPAQTHWQRILVMAGAWHGGLAGDNQFVKNSTLRTAISSAMDYWFGRDFSNPTCLDSGGTPACPCSNPDNSLWNTNWFSNVYYSHPRACEPACLLLNDTLIEAQLNNCTHMTGRSYGTFDHNINGVGFLTGANTLDVAKIGIDQALLTFNATLLTDAIRRVHLELQVKSGVKVDGIRADGSFGQHAGILYNGNYGNTNDVLDLEVEAGGTQFAAGTDSQEALATLFDGDRWMIFSNSVTGVLHWDFSVLGRFISFPVIDDHHRKHQNQLDEVLELGQQWSSGALTNFANSLSASASNANAGQLIGNRMFYANDYMVQRGNNYVTSVKMYSSRTQNSECTNSQNVSTFNLLDEIVDLIMLQPEGNEYEDIAAAWDWNLIPGITVDYGATALVCGTTQQTGVENFVGGVSDDTIGVAAMRFTNPLTRSLHWQKAWFFLENDVQHVMVSNISSSTNASIFTVLDQRRHVGTVVLNDKESGSSANANAETLWHGNVGYVFPDFNGTASVSVQVGEKTGNWSTIGTSTQPPAIVDLFAAWIEHHDISAPISYTVLPGITQKAFAKKAKKFALQAIQNDSTISAIYDKVDKIAMFVFWEANGGSVTFSPGENLAPIMILATGNIALIYRLDTGEITVSDPSQSLITVQYH